MIKEINSSNKRALLKSLVVGGALSQSQWATPVIKSVMVPVHAATSGPLRVFGGSSLFVDNNDLQFQDYADNNNSILDSALDSVVSKANAQGCPGFPRWEVYAEKAGAPLDDPIGDWDVYLLFSQGECCPFGQHLYKRTVTYSSPESEYHKLGEVIGSCGIIKPREDRFKMRGLDTDNPSIEFEFDDNIKLNQGGSKPEVDCCAS